MTCIDCDTDGLTSPVDFCSNPACPSDTIRRGYRAGSLIRPHVPAHDVIKLRRDLTYRHHIHMFIRAKDALTEARRSLSEPPNPEQKIDYSCGANTTFTGANVSGALCLVCNRLIRLPCWYCLECTGKRESSEWIAFLSLADLFLKDGFICPSCDAKGGADVGDHKRDHALVWFRDTSKEAAILPMEEYVLAMNDKVLRVEDHMRTVKEQVQSIINRQSRLEEMLGMILTKLGCETKESFVEPEVDL